MKSLLSYDTEKNILHTLLQCSCPARRPLQQQAMLTSETDDSSLKETILVHKEITKNLHSWLTRAAKCAWPRGCGIALKKVRYILWKTCSIKPHTHSSPKQDYAENFPLPLYFNTI